MVQWELGFLAFMLTAVLLLMYVMLNGDSEMHERDCIGFLFRRMVNVMDFFGGDRFAVQMERIVGKACCARLYAWQVRRVHCLDADGIWIPSASCRLGRSGVCTFEPVTGSLANFMGRTTFFTRRTRSCRAFTWCSS